MEDQDKLNLTSNQKDYALFLPAISGFYAAFIGYQRKRYPYVPPERIPQSFKNDVESINFLDPKNGVFYYKWGLYSAGHANLDLNKQDDREEMIRTRPRDGNSWVLGDSGGFQIGKGIWAGEWKDPNCQEVKDKMAECIRIGTETRIKKVKDKNTGKMVDKEYTVDLVKEYQGQLDATQQKREQVLNWLDTLADGGMILDIPTWIVKDKKGAAKKCQIETVQQAVDATKYNNEYFIKHRKGVNNGGARFLNVLQGSNHTDAEEWYEEMKVYCDPAVYPDKHFNGWAMGGQNMCDVHLILKRLVTLRHDNLLQEGKHDWMHFLGTSKLEYAVLLTTIQRAVRKYVNPKFQITFDCASPFLATANGQVYHQIVTPNRGKWSYRMAFIADDKKYATDTRQYGPAAVQDGLIDVFEESPVSVGVKMNDVCTYADGDLNRMNMPTKTSWDSFSYAILMAHNCWMHIESVQRANREFDSGNHPGMMWGNFIPRESKTGQVERIFFGDLVEQIFATPDKQEALDIIEYYSKYWMGIIGTRGNTGNNTIRPIENHSVLQAEGTIKAEKRVKEKYKPILDLFEEV